MINGSKTDRVVSGVCGETHHLKGPLQKVMCPQRCSREAYHAEIGEILSNNPVPYPGGGAPKMCWFNLSAAPRTSGSNRMDR